METLYIKERIPNNDNENFFHYEVVEHCGKKFLLSIKGDDAYYGTNKDSCLMVMNQNGSWDKVVLYRDIDEEPNNGFISLTYTESRNKFIDNINMIITEFKKYIVHIY